MFRNIIIQSVALLFVISAMAASSKIEAEAYSAVQGVKLEETTDEGGGQSLAYISNGDYAEYPIEISESGYYKFRFRIASNNRLSGKIELSGDDERIGEVVVPYTGGWQDWQSISKVFFFEQTGKVNLRLKFLGGEGSLFNVNWFSYGLANPVELTVANRPQQKMRYGMDFERLWFWPRSEKDQKLLAKWSVVDCDIDYIRVAINCGYELQEGTYVPKAYTHRILPMMRVMTAADPDLKLFASPRPLDEAIKKAAWQPYPRWITGQRGNQFDFKPQKCGEYLVRYIELMKSHGYKIDFLDVTNEWQGFRSSSGKVTTGDVVEVRNYLEENLAAEDMPKIIAPSAWSYREGSYWLRTINSPEKRAAIDIAAAHNTDKAGSAKQFVEAARTYLGDDIEVWNTELHGWKSVKNTDEVLSSSHLFEAIEAGMSGINGWLAVGTKNQGHSYYLNEGGKLRRKVKYYIFQKLANTSNYGHAYLIDDGDKFENAVALVRDNRLTVWVLNEAANGQVIRIKSPGMKFAEQTAKQTRWSKVAELLDEGISEQLVVTSKSTLEAVIEGQSLYCFEILLDGK